jgi:hypothetical protein
VVPVAELTAGQIEAMFALMDRHYENLQRDIFTADLRAKDHAILLTDQDGAVHGFSTVVAIGWDASTQLLFSGDTVVDHRYWGSHDLPATWLRHAMAQAQALPGRTFWLLLSKGYKTYKYLPLGFLQYYPHPDHPTPPEAQALIDAFATSRYGDRYQDGIVQAGRDHVREEFARVPPDDRQATFFTARNPGYGDGDELVCLAEVALDNLSRVGRRLVDAAE